MLHSLQNLLAPAVAQRLTLVINHVLASETVATDRLRPHAGRSLALALDGWPRLLPAPPDLRWRITPAGLLEWCGLEPAGVADLGVRLDASNPALLVARTLAGDAPAVQVEGDSQLAGDVNWLLRNLRWDVEADLERLFGPVAAPQLHRLGSTLARALRSALNLASQGAAGLGGLLRPRQ